jgi:hypothetical protein
VFYLLVLSLEGWVLSSSKTKKKTFCEIFSSVRVFFAIILLDLDH